MIEAASNCEVCRLPIWLDFLKPIMHPTDDRWFWCEDCVPNITKARIRELLKEYPESQIVAKLRELCPEKLEALAPKRKGTPKPEPTVPAQCATPAKAAKPKARVVVPDPSGPPEKPCLRKCGRTTRSETGYCSRSCRRGVPLPA